MAKQIDRESMRAAAQEIIRDLYARWLRDGSPCRQLDGETLLDAAEGRTPDDIWPALWSDMLAHGIDVRNDEHVNLWFDVSRPIERSLCQRLAIALEHLA